MPNPEELAALADVHLASIIALLAVKRRLEEGEDVATEIQRASADESEKRMLLLEWQASTTDSALLKLKLLLGNALVAQIPFEKDALDLIKREPERFRHQLRLPDSGE